MGNAGCCNADREERLQMDHQIAGANPEGTSNRGGLKGASMNEPVKSSKKSFQPIEKEVINKNHTGTQPSDGIPLDKMFEITKEAQDSLDRFGAFSPNASKPSGQMSGPYKFIADTFNVNYFIPAITNTPVSGKVK
jgi:hypothetical protein